MPLPSATKSASFLLICIGFALLKGIPSCDATKGNHRSINRALLQTSPEQSQKAKQFCTAPEFEKLTCGWASKAEQAQTITGCPLCGTIARVPPASLPAEVQGHHTYNQFLTYIVSLACKGPVIYRSVFKMLEEPATVKLPGWSGTNCTNSGLVLIDDQPQAQGGQASPVVRCELHLSSDGGTEVERALKSKEGKCWQCGRCSRGQGCPSNVGMWYSDVFTSNLPGCNFDTKKGFEVHRVGININPQTKILLAKFEACDSSSGSGSCFNKAYEQAKIKAAQPCTNAKCPA